MYEDTVTRQQLIGALGTIAIAMSARVRAVLEKAARATRIEVVVDGETIARVNVT